MILAIDSSTALTSVSVTDEDAVVIERSHLDARRHAEVLAPMIREVLDRAGADRASITTIACGVGPGPYTGLRVGIASALALGAAWGVPVVGLCSLDAIAAAAGIDDRVHGFGVAADARRHEVYWAWYSPDGSRVEGPLVTLPADIDPELRAGRWLGAGAHAHREAFGSVLDDDDVLVHPHASWVGRRVHLLLAEGQVPDMGDTRLSAHGEDGQATSVALRGVDLLTARPLYLRRPDAVPSRPA